MPFQVGFSNKQRQFSQVVLISAGDDQLHICSPQVQLQAIVSGNIAGHVVEWEQLEGTAVVLMNANTLAPSYDIIDNTDKKFRVWIDRYTTFEQSDEVLIFRTPTSYGETSFNNNQPFFQTGIFPLAVETDDIEAFVNVTMPPPTSLQGEESNPSIVVEITWEHPINTIYQPYIAQYKVVEDGLVVDDLPDTPISTAGDGLGLPSEPLFYPGTFADYRIDTYYNIAGIEYIRESETKIFSTLTVPLVRGFNDNAGLQAFHPDQQYFSRVNYTNIVQSAESNNNTNFNMEQQYFSRVSYSNIVQSAESVGNTSFAPDAQWINITRYDPSGIGSS